MSLQLSSQDGSFSYSPIREPDGIRLLVIHPGSSGSEEIHCSLVHTTLSICDSDIFDHYIALSYVWGDGTAFKSTYINKCSVNITLNLYLALQDIRDETRPLRLWADALCINQKDDKEKGLQVAMMEKIYSVAHHTIIHLGASGSGHENIIEFSGKKSRTEAAKAILGAPWFSRTWVFQELVLSRDPWVQCGRSRWKWDYVCDILQNYVPAIPKPIGWNDLPAIKRQKELDEMKALQGPMGTVREESLEMGLCLRYPAELCAGNTETDWME